MQQGGHEYENAEHYHLNIRNLFGTAEYEMQIPLFKNEIRTNDNTEILQPAATVGSIRQYIINYEIMQEPFKIQWLRKNEARPEGQLLTYDRTFQMKVD